MPIAALAPVGSPLRGALVLLVALAVGCSGQISDPLGSEGSAGETATRPGETAGPTAPGETGTAFELPRDKLLLLPFDVRMNMLAAVVGVALDDPMFDDLRAHRYELGDHDYASGTAPDLSWTASRMTVWLRALRPVCASDAMRARYPSLRDSLDAFVLAAYGRRATDGDRAAYDEAVGGAGLTADEEHRAMCLALLASAEMVAQ